MTRLEELRQLTHATRVRTLQLILLALLPAAIISSQISVETWSLANVVKVSVWLAGCSALLVASFMWYRSRVRATDRLISEMAQKSLDIVDLKVTTFAIEGLLPFGVEVDLHLRCGAHLGFGFHRLALANRLVDLLEPFRSDLVPDGDPTGVAPPLRTREAAARVQARSSFGDFVRAARSADFRGASRSVKVPVRRAGAVVDHVWADDPIVDGETVSVMVCTSTPTPGASDKRENLQVSSDEVVDWMLVRDGEVYGAFGLIARCREIADDERKVLEDSLGFSLPRTPRIP